MAVFYKNAETKLLDRLLNLEDQRSRWRVAIFPGSGMEKSNKRQLLSAASVKEIQQMTMDSEISAYVCHDSDIVFLFSNSRQNLLQKFKELVMRILPHIRPEDVDLETAFLFHDLGVEYDAVMQKMQEKIRQKGRRTSGNVAGTLPEPADIPSWDDKKIKEALAQKALRVKPLIAVIDDDESIRMLTRTVLRPAYQVVTAPDAASGIELINSQAPDIIFLDIQMPDTDGIETLSIIMKHLPDAHVMMLSARSTESNIATAIKLGAKSFITKPFTAKTLLTRVEKIVKGDFSE